MGEWLKPAVLKTVSVERRSGVRIPLPPPYFLQNSFHLMQVDVKSSGQDWEIFLRKQSPW